MCSGTSADGISVVIVDIQEERKDGNNSIFKFKQIAFDTIPYTDQDRALVFQLFSNSRDTGVQGVCRANFELGKCFAKAILSVIQSASVPIENIAVIGTSTCQISLCVNGTYFSFARSNSVA
jgi:anhydro-N-acetylmuramic acid kinase